jgi:amidohydrolase
MNYQELITEIKNLAKQEEKNVIAYRRHLHSNPELSFVEFETSKFIKSKLDEMGIPYQSIADTGVLGVIGNGEPCVALRADMDALPVIEETGLSCASKNIGIMHACGHDFHTAILLGAAKILKELEHKLNGSVKLIFQPAEESLPGGAIKIIEDGALFNPKPVMIFGQHVDPEHLTGTIALKSGPILASTCELYWTVIGKSCHAATPHLGYDPVLASAHLITHFQSLMNKFRNPLDSAVLTVTSISGESATNIIPERVELKGTLRTYNMELQDTLLQLIHESTKKISSLFGCETHFKIVKGYPSTINDENAVSIAKEAASEVLEKENVLPFEPKMWAEDFSYYGQIVPACFWFLGVKPNPDSEIYTLHNSRFSPDEKALKYGMELMAAAAAKCLSSLVK